MSDVADAVHYAHETGLVHRDLKPANILIDLQGQPRVADFGLAIHTSAQQLEQGGRAGSPAYMAPERVRGETHRFDGRTDQWSLGVILYELLAGHRPFSGSHRSDLFVEIDQQEVPPLRQTSPEVPIELDRICMKCLSKRMADRYATTADLAAELRDWLQFGDSDRSEIDHRPAVIPKGLRSFDKHDTEFFLQLLPGPRDRDGLPESIRFWKTRVEQLDPDETFAVGLIYGPSGCGKTSLVQAGLLPRLDDQVCVVYVESTSHDTEVRILNGLRKHFPDIPADRSLPSILSSLREGDWLNDGSKVLVVLDQFEQWLHAKGGDLHGPLIDALRQCDGGRVQCIVMVRDDFWMAATRFLDELEIDLLKGENVGSVDLFDPRHARRVLADFGRAYHALPDNPAETTSEQHRFLDQAVGPERAGEH